MHYAIGVSAILGTPCVLGFLQPVLHTGLERCKTTRRFWTVAVNHAERTKETRLYVGGKIFGIEDEPEEESDAQGAEGTAAQGEGDADGEQGEGDEDEYEEAEMLEGTVVKPLRKKRRKYSSTDEDYFDREDKRRRLAQEVARKYPDIGQVVVDRYGKIIGGVNPFEGTEYKLEDQPTVADQKDFPELAGNIAGMDDPADAPWRVELVHVLHDVPKAESIIRYEVTKCGLTCYDILWTFHKLEVTVTRGEGDGPAEEAGYVDSDKLMQAIRGVNTALEAREDELFVLGRHELIVATPGSKDVLTTDREFKAFKGFDVIVKTGGPFKNKRELEGKLFDRTFDELTITQSGRKVRIPLALVDEVRLPPAMAETGDRYP